MAKGKHKNLFKIWDKANQRYISGNKSKTHWNSMKWVDSKLFELCSPKSGYRYNKPRNPADFEVHEFELVIVNTISATQRVKIAEGKMDEAERLEIEITKVKDAILRAVGTNRFPLHDIRIFTNNGFFNDEIQGKLLPLFKELDKLNKN